MKYEKPEIIAQNTTTGSYAAGCPAERCGSSEAWCKECERTM